MIRTLAILTAIFLVGGILAQCPSSFVLSTGVNGQTYYLNAFSPYTSENSSPPTLFTDRTNATLFSLSSNGTAVAQVPATPSGPFANQDLIKFTQGQVSTEPLLILYAAQNRQGIYPITVQCAADGSVTFTIYGLDENETSVEPEVSTGFMACPNGDGGQLQLFNTGTPNHPNVGAPDMNACITGLTVKAITADPGSSSPGARSSGLVTDSSNIAVSTRPTTAAARYTNSTTGGASTSPAGRGSAGSADTFNTNVAVIITIVTFVELGVAQGIPYTNYETSSYISTVSYVPGDFIAVAGNTITNASGAASHSLTVTVTKSSNAGTPVPAPAVTVITNPDAVAISSTLGRATMAVELPSTASPATEEPLCICDDPAVVATGYYNATGVTLVNLESTTYRTSHISAVVGLITVTGGAIFPATPTFYYTAFSVSNTKVSLETGQSYQTKENAQTIMVPLSGSSGGNQISPINVNPGTTATATSGSSPAYPYINGTVSSSSALPTNNSVVKPTQNSTGYYENITAASTGTKAFLTNSFLADAKVLLDLANLNIAYIEQSFPPTEAIVQSSFGAIFPAQNPPRTYLDYQGVTRSYPGFTRAALIEVSDQLTNSAINLLYYSCVTKFECLSQYNGVDDAKAGIYNIVTNNFNSLLARFEGLDSSYNYFPEESNALFFTYYNNFPIYTDEVYGVHDLLPNGIRDGFLNGSVINATEAVKNFAVSSTLEVEALINIIAVV